MKKRKTLAVIVAALLAVAPISAPFVNNNNSAQVVQASRRHRSHRSFIKHTYNWNIKYTWNKRSHHWNKMRLRSSRAWQREFKQSLAEDSKVTDDYDGRAFNYNNPNIIQQIKAYNAADNSTLFPSNHAAIYVRPYLPKRNYKLLQKIVARAAQKWEPAFHFTMTDNPKNANVTVVWSFKRNRTAVADEEDCDFEPETHKVITLYDKEIFDYDDDYSNLGLEYLIAHELGHAIGLPHDTNLDSVMNDDDSEYEPTNDEDFKHYQAPWVTAANKRVIEELYSQN